ncbi:hypothetical protein BJ508DRAFT_6963 [Ascobolus immersus RN42]|uniref:Uncharacterized protein n=1 Tax=Ascobolus immersus RN42 TaxID=1160509 RepID=A0A3N4IGQ1_ASCIM|nr:hypothetical protein BJ508DRAFT_6963 [Ascobolus immersus RN42]
MSRLESRHSKRNNPSTTSDRPYSRTTTTSSNSARTSTTTSKPYASNYLSANKYDRDLDYESRNERPAIDTKPSNSKISSRYRAPLSLAPRSQYAQGEENTDQLPTLSQGPLFADRIRSRIALGTTKPEELVEIGHAWQATAGDKTLGEEIDKVIGDDDERRLNHLLSKGKSATTNAKQDYGFRETLPVRNYASYEEERAPQPARKGSMGEEDKKLETLKQRLDRDRARRKQQGLLNSDYGEQITKEIQYQQGPPSSPPAAFFTNNRTTRLDRWRDGKDTWQYKDPTVTVTDTGLSKDWQSDEFRERRKQRKQQRDTANHGEGRERKDEPSATASNFDKLRQERLLEERRIQRAEERKAEKEARRKAAEEEEASQRETEQRQSRQQYGVLQERPNGASNVGRENRFAPKRFGENKLPSQTRIRPASPPRSNQQSSQNPPAAQKRQASQSLQQFGRPQSGGFGITSGLLIDDTSDEEQELPQQRQSEQSGTLEVPIPGTPAFLLKNSRKYSNKGKEKASEEETDTWTRLKNLSTTTLGKPLPDLVAVPSPIPEERDSQLSPPPQPRPTNKPTRAQRDKPETATLMKMDDLAGMGNSLGSVLSDSMDTSDDDEFSATREIEKKLGLESPEETPGSTADVEQPAQSEGVQDEPTEYFDADVKPETLLSPLPQKERANNPDPPPPPPPTRPTRNAETRTARTQAAASGSTSATTTTTKHRPVGEPIKDEVTAQNRRSRRPVRSRMEDRPRTPSPPTQSASLDLNAISSPTLDVLQREQQAPRRRQGLSNSDQTKREPSDDRTFKPSTPRRSTERDPYDTSPDETADDTQLLLGINKKLRTVRSEVRNAYDGIENLERTLYTFENPPVQFGLDTLWYGLRNWVYRWRWFLVWPLLLTVWVLAEVSWMWVVLLFHFCASTNCLIVSGSCLQCMPVMWKAQVSLMSLWRMMLSGNMVSLVMSSGILTIT